MDECNSLDLPDTDGGSGFSGLYIWTLVTFSPGKGAHSG
jgi:hypothetical protein